MTTPRLIIRYAAFAVIATVANLATQAALLTMDRGPIGYIFALVAGTVVGMGIKYVLDRRWIFAGRGASLRADSRRLGLYMTTSIVTTAIFWTSETAFWLLTNSDPMRVLGAVLGLSVGYVVKYRLDKRFVFTGAPSEPRADA